MSANPDFIKDHIFNKNYAKNWLIHSRGFYHAGCQLMRVVTDNAKGFPKMITSEMVFYHRYSNKIAVYLLSHSIELLLKGAVSYYNMNNKENKLKDPTSYSHKIRIIFNDLVKVDFVQKNDGDDELIELIDCYLQWYGRYFSPMKKQIEKVLENDYDKDENGFIDFKHDLTDAHKKIISLHKRISQNIKLGNLYFDHMFHAP